MEFSGKKALVTGSSRGIGREMALALANAGADVAVNYVGNQSSAEEVQRDIIQMGRKCVLVKVDLSKTDCADILWQELAE